eukprot:scaffold25509_cov75-Phaeocystis_antarctica.AAC.2
MAAGECSAKSGSGRPPTIADLKSRAFSLYEHARRPEATLRVTCYVLRVTRAGPVTRNVSHVLG